MDAAVPFFDAAAAYRSFRRDVDAAVHRVLASGHVILGPEVETFEREFAAYTGAVHAVGVASGTDAIALSLRAIGIGAGDEVLTVANAGVPPVAAICAAGATPLFVDVDPATLLVTPEAIAAAATPRCRAIVAVHLYGQPVRIEAIRATADRLGLALVEDCAHAHGLRIGDRHAGTFGVVGCFSFYPTKNLGGFGDGGVCITNDPGIAASLRRLRVYGADADGRVDVVGCNSRLDELQAAILRVLLRSLDQRVARRRHLARLYEETLAASCARPLARDYDHDAAHLYVVRHPERDRLVRVLAAAGIGSKPHYPLPVHRMAAFRPAASAPPNLPHTDAGCGDVLSLPLYPELDPGVVARIGRAILRP